MSRKMMIFVALVIIASIISAIIVLSIIAAYSISLPQPVPKNFIGELEPYCINETRDIIIFYVRILPNPDNVTGVYRPNLLDPDVTRRGYVLTVGKIGNESSVVVFPDHQYIDVQNDYTINTGDLLILYNRSRYIGMRVILTVEGSVMGDIRGDVV